MNNESDRLTMAQWILERQIGWITSADAKVGVVVAIQAAMVGALAAAYGSAKQPEGSALFFAGFALLLSVLSLVCAALALFPRTDGPSSSFIFFGKITTLTREEYVSQLSLVSEEKLLADCAQQIHRNAEIAGKKHEHVRHAMIWGFASVAPWVLAIWALVSTQGAI
ncbi:MAG: Pycsar system effector family protein [Gallionellaceae bacterium]|jgi:hypothetical protein